jgi:hypothetical protein
LGQQALLSGVVAGDPKAEAALAMGLAEQLEQKTKWKLWNGGIDLQ